MLYILYKVPYNNLTDFSTAICFEEESKGTLSVPGTIFSPTIMADSKNLAPSSMWLNLYLKSFDYANQVLHSTGRTDPQGVFALVRQLGSPRWTEILETTV